MDVIDAYTRPPAADTLAAGFGGAFGYLLGATAKDATAAEISEMLHAGGVFALVAEGSATDLGFGRGAEVGRAADAQATGIGWPDTGGIYYTADRYVPASGFTAIGVDLDRIRTVAPLRPRGLYGGAPLVQWALDHGHADKGWIASAPSWSGVSTKHPDGTAKTEDQVAAEMVALAPSAHLIQRRGYLEIAGHTCDRNNVLREDFGQIPAPAPPAPAPSQEHVLMEIWLSPIPSTVEPGQLRHFLVNGPDDGKPHHDWRQIPSATARVMLIHGVPLRDFSKDPAGWNNVFAAENGLGPARPLTGEP